MRNLGILIRKILNFSPRDVLRIDDGYSFGNSPINYSLKGIGGFPIEKETQISKFIAYSLAIFIL